MPEVRFQLEWPDGHSSTLYSPSTVILDYFRPAIRCLFLSLKSAELKPFVLLLSVFVRGMALPARAQMKKNPSCFSGSLATAPMIRFVFSDSLLNCYFH